LDFHGATRRNEFPGAARGAILDFGLPSFNLLT
jgi:hypothetical protein